jgi:peptidyl-prolyl cis-trans isomerase-like protein 2
VGESADAGARLQDPFEEYQKRLKARLAHQDQSDEALRRRAEAAKERDKDRTTWLGTDLGTRGESKVDKEKRKRKDEDEGGTVGRYLQAKNAAGSTPTTIPAAAASALGKGTTTTARSGPPSGGGEFGMEKKKKKGGGFGDFSGW